MSDMTNVFDFLRGREISQEKAPDIGFSYKKREELKILTPIECDRNFNKNHNFIPVAHKMVKDGAESFGYRTVAVELMCSNCFCMLSRD